MLLGCTAIVAVGIWDDICNIPAKVKLVGQILAACIPIAFGIQIEWLTNPFGDIIVLPELIAIPVTIFWIIGFTNTVNLIDGLDGLAAGVAFIASISMFLLAYNLNQFLRPWSSSPWQGQPWAFCSTISTRPRSSWAIRAVCSSAIPCP